MKNQRVFVRLIRELCEAEGIGLRTYCHDWVMQLTRDGRDMFLYGYQFPNNDAAGELICGDKAALAAILRTNGIPAAQHEFFMPPAMTASYGGEGNWKRLQALLEQYGRLVLKTNSGSGGSGVYAVENQAQLEQFSAELLRPGRYMTASPYYDIENEYRLIWCNGEVRIAYRKVRPSVTGNGRDSIGVLMEQKYGANAVTPDAALELERVPAQGEEVLLNWRHNLGQGASAELLEDGALKASLCDLARRATELLHLRFASVDIIAVGGELMILEINSGIMTEVFASTSEEGHQMALALYRDAVLTYFRTLA